MSFRICAAGRALAVNALGVVQRRVYALVTKEARYLEGIGLVVGERVAHGVPQTVQESPDRFARDLAVQLAGHDYLKGLGVSLIPASAPDFFLEDTPTAVLVRQVLGAIAQFDKATTVAKLRAARERMREATGKCEGRKSYAERDVDLVAKAKELSERRPRMSLREISAALAQLGKTTPRGKLYSASAIASMLGR
jgi:DNA invertase Pin-like site-specific DNA recombinase